MDAAVAAAEKAMEGIGMPDDDEEEEAPIPAIAVQEEEVVVSWLTVAQRQARSCFRRKTTSAAERRQLAAKLLKAGKSQCRSRRIYQWSNCEKLTCDLPYIVVFVAVIWLFAPLAWLLSLISIEDHHSESRVFYVDHNAAFGWFISCFTP